MVMKELVSSFPQHISEAIQIANTIESHINYSNIDNILIAGQGGSAIGGLIAKNLLKDELSIPLLVNQDYKIPNFVNDRTLVIASSYSGNTEETLCALRAAYNRKSIIFCICSGGEMLNFAQHNAINHVTIPSGSAPRAMLCYSLVQILFLICKTFGVLKSIENDLLDVRKYLIENQHSIIKVAQNTVDSISNKMPFIYTFPEFEGVAIRFKQQLNENSKRHACYNVIPEMNHNEIVPWVKKNTCVIPIFLNGKTSSRNTTRMQISIDSIKNNVEHFLELNVEDNLSYLNQYFHFLHLVDWVSIIIAEQEDVDPNDIALINSLKEQLKNI